MNDAHLEIEGGTKFGKIREFVGPDSVMNNSTSAHSGQLSEAKVKLVSEDFY